MSDSNALPDFPAVESAIVLQSHASPSRRSTMSKAEVRQGRAQGTDSTESPSRPPHSMVLRSRKQDNFDAPPSAGLRSRTMKQNSPSGRHQNNSRSLSPIKSGSASNVLKRARSGATNSSASAPTPPDEGVPPAKRQKRRVGPSKSDKEENAGTSPTRRKPSELRGRKPGTPSPKKRGRPPKIIRNPAQSTSSEATSSQRSAEFLVDTSPTMPDSVPDPNGAVGSSDSVFTEDIETPHYSSQVHFVADPLELHNFFGGLFRCNEYPEDPFGGYI